MALALACLGCHTGTHQRLYSIAHVEIMDSSEQEIAAHVRHSFEQDGYELVKQDGGELVFERVANQREQTLYGRYGETLLMRVEILTEPMANGGHLVECDVYTVLGRRVSKLLKMSRRPYQKRLNRIKAAIALGLGPSEEVGDDKDEEDDET